MEQTKDWSQVDMSKIFNGVQTTNRYTETVDNPNNVPEFEWSEPAKPNSFVSKYDHVIAKTQFGDIVIEWDESDVYNFLMPFRIDGESTYRTAYSLEDAKRLAYDWYNYYLVRAFGYNIKEPKQ